MTIQEITIISNNICYAPIPQLNDEVEQHLTISITGQVHFTGYNYTEKSSYKIGRNKKLNIPKEAALRILSAVQEYFSSHFDGLFITDIGRWKMTITDTKGKKRKFMGSLYAQFSLDGVDLSDLIRGTLKMDYLYVFDGGMPIILTTYIFCSVRFGKSNKNYYYLTDDGTLKIGDFVLVPVDNHERTAIAEIIAIEEFSEDEVPFPVSKSKNILRKCSDDDFSVI